jgi:hypothetical protein
MGRIGCQTHSKSWGAKPATFLSGFEVGSGPLTFPKLMISGSGWDLGCKSPGPWLEPPSPPHCGAAVMKPTQPDPGVPECLRGQKSCTCTVHELWGAAASQTPRLMLGGSLAPDHSVEGLPPPHNSRICRGGLGWGAGTPPE